MTNLIKILSIYLVFLIITSCGNNPLEKTRKVDNRVLYRSALTADDKDVILKNIYNLVLVCDVYQKSEFIYIVKFENTYNVHVSDGANSVPLTLHDKEDNIIMGNKFNLYYDLNDNQYLESLDSIIVNDEFYKLEIVDETESFRSINRIKIDDNFNSIFIEKLYDLVNCQNKLESKNKYNFI